MKYKNFVFIGNGYNTHKRDHVLGEKIRRTLFATKKNTSLFNCPLMKDVVVFIFTEIVFW